MTAIIDVYGEFDDYVFTGGSIGSGLNIRTDNCYYRNQQNSGFAYTRCAIGFSTGNSDVSPTGSRMWGTSMTTGWFGARIAFDHGFGGNTQDFIAFYDTAGIIRLFIIPSGIDNLSSFDVYKVDASGAQTLLGTTTSGFAYQSSNPDKIDIYFNYNTSGSLQIYSNSAPIFNYSGDITTDGTTHLQGTRFRSWGLNNNQTLYVSECVLSDSDTRNVSIITNVAAGVGTLDQWTGAYTNVNQVDDSSDNSYDVAGASGETQRYTMGTIPVANYTVLAKVTNLRATQGTGSLTHLALSELINDTSYTTSAKTIPTTFGSVQFIQPVNPATGVAWTEADLNADRESGYQATT
jgi:hypothetical protein